jgi:membrane-associated phospholipid phosphatase
VAAFGSQPLVGFRPLMFRGREIKEGNLGEWIQLVFVSLLAVAAWLRPLGLSRQLMVSKLALIAIGAIVIERISGRRLPPIASPVVHDWLPATLLLVPYWQIGQFFTGPDPRTEARLAAFDRAFFKALGIRPANISISTAAGTYLEIAFLVVYPLMPLGLIALYATGLRQFVDYYWVVVLPSTYICFAITPFVQAMPPRMLSGYNTFTMPASKAEAFNHRVLHRASIQAITFPSGHVASATGAALVLLRLERWMDLIFLVIAISIAVATVVGGYHYAADVLLASVVAVAVFVATFWILKPG